MADVEVRAEGGDQLAASLARAADAAADLTETNRAAGALVVLGAEVPRVTGYLESTITVTADGAGVTVTAGAPYAGYVHARNPFLTDARTEAEAAVIDLYTDRAAGVVDLIQGA